METYVIQCHVTITLQAFSDLDAQEAVRDMLGDMPDAEVTCTIKSVEAK